MSILRKKSFFKNTGNLGGQGAQHHDIYLAEVIAFFMLDNKNAELSPPLNRYGQKGFKSFIACLLRIFELGVKADAGFTSRPESRKCFSHKPLAGFYANFADSVRIQANGCL